MAINGKAGFHNLVRVMRNPDNAWFTSGSFISFVGTWVQRIGLGWMAWELTHSATWLGIISLADLLPTAFVGPFAGALADRLHRVRLVQVTQCLAAVQALALTVLAYSGQATIEAVVALTAVSGIISASWQPARLSLIAALSPREDLSASIAVNSLAFHTSRFVGPLLAGVVIANGGVALAFAVNAVSYIAILFSLTRLRPGVAGPRPARAASLGRDIVEGYSYAARHKGIGPALLLAFITAMFGRALLELLPGYADHIFDAGATGLAWMTAVNGAGAIVAGVWIAQRGGVAGLTRLTNRNVLLAGLALLAFAAAPNILLGLVCMFALGFALLVCGIANQTLVQHAVDESMRGRVGGLLGMIWRGSPALGALAMGTAADRFGLTVPVVGVGLCCIVASLWAQRHEKQTAAALEI